jgi:hypothetical protein
MTDSGNGKIKIRDTVRGRPYRFFDAQGVDELVSISMALAQELWTVKERMVIFEALAAHKGLGLDKDIEDFKLNPEQLAALATERQAFIDRIFLVLREQAEAVETSSIPEPEPPE